MESYEVKNMPVSYSRGIKISFCAVADEITENVKKSVESIINIAEEIGYPYELVVSTHEPVNFKSENIKFINEEFSTYGAGKQLAYLKSTGDFLIVFNPTVSYGPEVSDIIHNFLVKWEKKVVLSDVMIIPRDLLDKTGGWRNLREYEDIDLLARMIESGGIVAFPSDHFDSLKYRKHSGETVLNRILNFRDAIISANYSFRDIGLLHNETLYISYISYILSRFSGVKPFKYNINNRIIVMESIMESLVLKDYENYITPGSIPKLKLTGNEIRYMEKRSELWNKINKSIMGIIQEVNN
jgi:hypothetical protein